MVWDHLFLSRWRKWIDQSDDAHVFFEPSMVRAWVETYERLKPIKPRFLIARNDNNCVIFLPLVQIKENWKGAFQTSLLPVGYSEFDYHDPIVVGSYDTSVTKSFLAAFLEELLNHWKGDFDVVVVNGLRLTSLPDDLKATPCDSAPFINLSGYRSIHELMRALGQSLRGDINRQRRRIERLGRTELRVYASDETNAALVSLAAMLEEHKAKWPRSYKALGLYENLVRRCLPDGVLHLSEFLLGGVPISWHIGFLHKSRYYWYMPVYRPEYQQYSPGKVHLYTCVEEALRKGITVFDFLKGDEDYKRQWTKDSIALCDLRYSSKRIVSSIRSALVSTIKPAISKVLHLFKK
jgi:CelD/BcsL family acetyltransferase involved in cellulose biosynthesis